MQFIYLNKRGMTKKRLKFYFQDKYNEFTCTHIYLLTKNKERFLNTRNIGICKGCIVS
jgi:hypothetical protein